MWRFDGLAVRSVFVVVTMLLPVAVSVVGAAPASAESLSLTTAEGLIIDLTTEEDPVLRLTLEGEEAGAIQPPVVLKVAAGSPLGEECDFVAAEDFPDAGETRVVTFRVRDAEACELVSLEAEEVEIRSTQIGDDRDVTVTLKREPAFPIDKFLPALWRAVLVALVVVSGSAVAAWVSWRRRPANRREDDRFWGHRLDSPELAWTFKDSWLSNLTALGAVLATVLAATDVFDVVGPGKPERAVFLLVNVAALIIAASAPLAYLALAGRKQSEQRERLIPVRVAVRALNGSPRHLAVHLPRVTYHSDNGRLTDPTVIPPSDRIVDHEWAESDRHIAVVAIPTEVTGAPDLVLPGKLRCVALDVVAAGHHDDRALLLYDAQISELQRFGDEIVPETESTTRHESYGRMTGFVAAAALASIAVAAQLAAMHSMLDQAELDSAADGFLWMLVPLVGLIGAGYIWNTILNRLPEFEDGEVDAATEVTHENGVRRMQVGDGCMDTKPEPVMPTLVINERLIESSEGVEGMVDIPLPAYPNVSNSFLAPSTSFGDEPRRVVRRLTAF